jgi:cellulose 1,4-beta-cellobiosidase
MMTAALSMFSTAPFAATGANPFLEAKTWYVNPANQAELDVSIATASGDVKKTLKEMRSVPSAYWIDRKEKIHGTNTSSLEGILADAASKKPAPLVVVILYDLPNRDCDAKASNGQICCTKKPDGTCDYDTQGDCADGIEEYKKTYVDPFAEVVGKYAARVPVAVIIEPDSLPNLATNAGHPHCGNSATRASYTQGIPYAIKTMAAKAPQATLYLDAAHGGWLGWMNNAKTFASLVAGLDVTEHIRGFTSNVANYQALGVACPAEAFDGQLPVYCQQHAADPCCVDPCHLMGQWNSGPTELNYVQMMTKELSAAVGNGFSPKWLIDTGRNGVDDERSDCSNWCNIRAAGAGLKPTVNTSLPSIVDAYFWLKTPGESDGCTQTLPDSKQCARFDSMCSSQDSLGSRTSEPRAPEAGKWFDYQIKMLASNAKLSPKATAGHDAAAPAGVKPFNACTANDACVGGYICDAGMCMPTAAKLEQAGGHGAFRTAYEHALARRTVEA